MDYYGILHVGRNASQEEIRKAYRRLSRKYHPDNAGEQCREQFDCVQKAYGILGDEEKRAAYDERIRADGAGAGSGRTADRSTNKRQPDKKEDYHMDLAAFCGGAYKNSFDKMFESFFKCK